MSARPRRGGNEGDPPDTARKQTPWWFIVLCGATMLVFLALALLSTPEYLRLAFWVALGLGIWWTWRWSGWEAPSSGPTPGTPLYEWQREAREEERHQELIQALHRVELSQRKARKDKPE